MWRTRQHPRIPPRAFASWHVLEELELCLHFVQAYIEGIPPPESTQNAQAASHAAIEPDNPRKRKAPGDGSVNAHENGSRLGLLTPGPSHFSVSRSPSVSSTENVSQVNTAHSWWDVTIYNGILQRREGWIVAKRVNSTVN